MLDETADEVKKILLGTTPTAVLNFSSSTFPISPKKFPDRLDIVNVSTAFNILLGVFEKNVSSRLNRHRVFDCSSNPCILNF